MFLCFDESPTNLELRTTGLGIPLKRYVDEGLVHLLAINTAEYSPGQLAHHVRALVEDGNRVVVVDSLNGYLSAMPEERFLTAHMHELLAYLAEKGVATIITLVQHGFIGDTHTPFNISYLADTVLLLRYFESAGEVRHALSVMKKRTGWHERTIREFRLGHNGFEIGEPIVGFQNILSGNLQFLRGELLRGERDPSD